MSKDLERIYRLAKGLAVMTGELVIVYSNADGTFGFMPYDDNPGIDIIEIISPY